MRAALEPFLYRSGALRLLGRRYAGAGVIFMLHSVVDDAGPYLAEPTRCTAVVLEQLLRHLQTNGIEILPLDAALARLAEPKAGRFAALTFDDGYRDNLTCALPLLERFGAPATVFVTTGMIERGEDAWWIGLVDWLKRCDRIAVEGFGGRETATLPEKIGARIELTRWVDSAALRVAALCRAMREDGVSIVDGVEREALDRDELLRLAHHPLIAIGGHTTSHPWLATLPLADARREIADNRRYLQDLTGGEIAHFAYPYGSPAACGEREAALVAEAGFAGAVTCRHGCIFPKHREHRFALPREGVHWYENEASLVCKSAGGQRLLRDLKRRRPWRSPVATMAAD
jgi:peptidoglycan/xylan/chitin deacetylase (PgdA/CDA1 family)